MPRFLFGFFGCLLSFPILAPLFALTLAFGNKLRLFRRKFIRFAAVLAPLAIFFPCGPRASFHECHRLLTCDQNHRHQIGRACHNQRARASQQADHHKSAQTISHHTTGARQIASLGPFGEKPIGRIEKNRAAQQQHRKAHQRPRPQTAVERELDDAKPDQAHRRDRRRRTKKQDLQKSKNATDRANQVFPLRSRL